MLQLYAPVGLRSVLQQEHTLAVDYVGFFSRFTSAYLSHFPPPLALLPPHLEGGPQDGRR